MFAVAKALGYLIGVEIMIDLLQVNLYLSKIHFLTSREKAPANLIHVQLARYSFPDCPSSFVTDGTGADLLCFGLKLSYRGDHSASSPNR